MKEKIQILLLTILCSSISFAQSIPVHPSKSNIYEFLDELSGLRIIELNTAIKPYSQDVILKKLNDASRNKTILNKRQVKELNYYLWLYSISGENQINPYSERARLNFFRSSENFSTGINPLGIFYKDSTLTFELKPIWGICYGFNEKSSLRYTWGGAEAYMTVGNHWGFYAHLVENNMTEPLSLPTYFVQQEGGNYKIEAEGINASTYSEMRGGIVYNRNWGSIGLIKDHLIWGEGYHGSNIFSGRTPSFPMIKINICAADWLDVNYFHGWLVSQVIDSTASYITSNGDFRAVYRNKYISANTFTFKLFQNTRLSLGNSIVYSDMKIHPGYLIPFLFFKSVDHTLNNKIDNQNSQMFGMLSIRSFSKLHIYSNIFIDDFSVLRITDNERQNFMSYKAGSKLYNWPLQNVNFIFEYTKTNPIVFKHRVETLSFESNQFNLGHYLRDNPRELFIKIQYIFSAKASLNLLYINAVHGNEYLYLNSTQAENLPFMKDISWSNEQIDFRLNFEFISGSSLSFTVSHSNTQGFDIDSNSGQYYMDLYTPKYLHGKNYTFYIGFQIGI
jgi:hypothetical protein